MLAADTTGKRASALAETRTRILGNREDRSASYLSAGPTVSTYNCAENIGKYLTVLYFEY